MKSSLGQERVGLQCDFKGEITVAVARSLDARLIQEAVFGQAGQREANNLTVRFVTPRRYYDFPRDAYMPEKDAGQSRGPLA